MTTVRVEYHRESEGWWADSEDVAGWLAGAETLEETRRLVREGLPFYLDDDDVELLEQYAAVPDTPVVVGHVESAFLGGGLTMHAVEPSVPAPVFRGEAASLQRA